MKQQKLFKEKSRTEHGGDKAKGKRKEARPFARNKWIHLVLKSDKARGNLSLATKRNGTFVKTLIAAKAKKFGVEIADYVNMGNHLHVKVRTATKPQLQAFLRATTGRIARFVTGAKRGFAFGRFWRALAYTRVLKSRLEEILLKSYFEGNRVEDLHGYEMREAHFELAAFKRRRLKMRHSPI